MQSSACAPPVRPSARPRQRFAYCAAGSGDHRHAPRGRRHRALDDAMMFAGASATAPRRSVRRARGRPCRDRSGAGTVFRAAAKSTAPFAERRRQRRARPVKLQDLGAHDTLATPHRLSANAAHCWRCWPPRGRRARNRNRSDTASAGPLRRQPVWVGALIGFMSTQSSASESRCDLDQAGDNRHRFASCGGRSITKTMDI